MLPLIVLFAIAFIVIAFICGMQKGIYGRFPRPVFRWFCSWWWPHRPTADAGVLVYQAVMAAPSKFKGDDEFIKGEMAGHIISVGMCDSNDGRARLCIGDQRNIPISAWGDFKLNQARRFLFKRASKTASINANAYNRERYVEGTRLAAKVLADGLREARPDLIVETVENRLSDFQTQARYLQARAMECELKPLKTFPTGDIL